jgi:hypothetical protein
MYKRTVIIGIIACGLLLAGMVFFMKTSPSTAETGKLLDEEQLLTIAVETAQENGLKSEPTILVREYIPGKEWGPMMTRSDVQYEPDLIVYVVSLTGEFEKGKTRTFLPPGVDNTFTPEGITVGINAHTGDIMTTITLPFNDLASMTTDADRLIYEAMSKEDWPDRKFESFPLPSYSPEVTAEPASLP